MTHQPITCTWDGESLTPMGPVWAKRADAQWVVGETYKVEVRQERSAASHAHYFAVVDDAWENLPEHLALRYPSSKHLRKWALVKAGYCTEKVLVCASPEEARRIGAFIRPMSGFAVIVVKESIVTVYEAQSQSERAMGKKAFQESKQRVLDIVADLLEVTPESLANDAGRAA